LFQPFGFTSRQVPHILALMASESGHFIVSPTHRIIRNRDFLVVTTLPQPTADLLVIDTLPCTIEAGRYTYTFALRPRPDVIPAGKDEAWLDSKGVTLPLLLRKWRNGDYLYPLGMKMKKKKVSRLLIDEKVSMHEKEELRVLECGKRIAWVPGIRIDERFRIAAGTAQVLVVKRTLSKNAGS
jgi:tRNA(Ile)-lysidine synthase